MISVMCVAVSAACSSAEQAKPNVESGATDGGVSDAANTAHEAYLGLTWPDDGFQVRSLGAEIAPGEDVEYCEVAQLPGDPSDTYYASGFELGNATNSHHLIVTAAVPGSEAERRAQALGLGNKVECISAELQFGAAGIEGVAGSQQPYRRITLPEGVGQVFHGGQLIVFDYHYLNAQVSPVPARSAINFHLAAPDSIVHQTKQFALRNYTIDSPPHADSSFTGECHFKQALMLGAIARHTHRWGADFTVWFSGGPRDGEQIWTSSDWEHDVDHTFDTPVALQPGDGLRFRCDYRNDTGRRLRFGTSASDEMCILFGRYWEADGGASAPDLDCDIVWTDADALGHPADEAGGFPVPSQGEQQACLNAVSDSACDRCRCESCARPAIRCGTDAACQGIVDCYKACPAGANCDIECQAAIDANSSGTGLITQMSRCFANRCGSGCR